MITGTLLNSEVFTYYIYQCMHRVCLLGRIRCLYSFILPITFYIIVYNIEVFSFFLHNMTTLKYFQVLRN